MSFPLMDEELAGKIEKSEIDYMIDRMKAIEERSGNPMGIEIVPFGGSTAYYSKSMPWGQFNTVKGICAHDTELLDDIIQFYKKRERNFQIEIIPSKANSALMKALTEKGFHQSGFHASLYGLPKEEAAQEDGIMIREIGKEEFVTYAEIHCLGTGLPIDGKDHVAANNIVLHNREGWRFFVGLRNKTPAGVGVMYMKDNVASLTFAATLPQYRNHGIQKALIERRMAKAYHNHCELVVGQATYATTSYRNMERAGMRLAYTRATWSQS